MDTPKGPSREAFAARLNEIREASGRTYGSLARRIDVSGSTLHRYCSGQTVPMDFAPVARMARFCGCEGEELVALHRLWVRADAERYEPPQPEEPQRPAELAQPVPEVTATAAAPETAPPGPARPDAAPVPGPAAARPRRGFGPPVRSGRARRLAYVVTAAVLPAVTALALVTASGDSSAPAAGLPSARTVTGADGPRTAPLASSGVPEAAEGPRALGGSDAPAERPSPDASGRTGSGGGPTTAPRSARTPESGSGPLPFTWRTDGHVWKNGCDHSYLIGRAADAVPPPPAEADAKPWARSLDAVHAGDTGVRITLQGRSEQAVVLESLRIRVTARREPVQRDVYRMSSGCGGALTPRVFDVDLDKPRPVARTVAGNDSGVPIPAVSLPYTVSATDPEVFLVTGRTTMCDCDWYLELAWTGGGRSGTVRVDDEGRPFRTSAAGGRAVLDYDTGDHRWVPVAREGG